MNADDYAKLKINKVKEISKVEAYPLVEKYHYSKVMPRLTKHYLGIYADDILVGILTLGWGTQPKGTINKLFPGSDTSCYYEIGKMCMMDEMPRNSETQMLSLVVKWIKENLPQKEFLYTWADGIVGKPGYVYQAANFLYGGFIWTDVYIGADGEKIHPRSSSGLLEENRIFLKRENRVFWMTPDFMKHKGIRRIKGKMFRYILPLSKKARRKLKTSTVKWTLEHPKHDDLQWKDASKGGKAKILNKMPEFDLEVVNVNKKNVQSYKKGAD